MLALIVIAGFLAGAQAYGGPVACCEHAGQFIADSNSRCIFYQCVNNGHGYVYVGVEPMKCPPGTRVPSSYVSPGHAAPCTEIIPYNYHTGSYESCDRYTPLSTPSYCDPHPPNKKPRCFDCNVELGDYATGGFQACLLKNKNADADKLDQWHCKTGQCFIRYEETKDYYGNVRKYLYRGCAAKLSPLIETDSSHQCQENTDGNKYYFCHGDLCNDQKAVCGH